VKLLTSQFEAIDAGDRIPKFMGNLRADMRARSIWYTGRATRTSCLRMLMTDGSLCTILYRLMGFLKRIHLGPLAAITYKLNSFLTGAVIGRGAEFGPGLIILHSQALVINASVKGGTNVILEGCVTIGAEKEQSPVLGDRVFVGSGARIIGAVTIGTGARIGANAVVVKDVPENATAVGVPAKVIKIHGEDG
jgi:serine O-acetyltransferase